MGRADHVMYRYMRNREHFADLFNGILFQGRNIIHPAQLLETTGQYTSPTWGHAKSNRRKHTERRRDIKMVLESGEVLRILAAENQNHVDYSMPFRCMEYDVLEYRKQLEDLKHTNWSHKNFTTQAEFLCGVRAQDRLVPVYTICLYHGEAVWDGPKSLMDMMDFCREPDMMRPFFADYPLKLFCVNAQTDFDMFHTELRELFLALNQRSNPEGLQQLMVTEPAYKHLSADTAEALSVLLEMPDIWEKRETYMGVDKEDYDMCYAVQKWREQDLAQGRNEGIALGRNEGILDKTKIVIENMLKRGFSDDDISALADCDLSLIKEIKERLP